MTTGELKIRVPAELKEALKVAAAAEHRSLNSMAVKVIADWLERQKAFDSSAGAAAIRAHGEAVQAARAAGGPPAPEDLLVAFQRFMGSR